MSNTKAISTQKPDTLRGWLSQEHVYHDLGHALGGWMHPDEFISQILIALSDPKLSQCTQTSKYQAAHTCAAMQLLPSVDHVALRPRKVFKDGRHVSTVVEVAPQWQGYKAIMERVPAVREVQAKLVHKEDQFSWNEKTNELHHDYDPFSTSRTWDKDLSGLRGAYVMVTYNDARPPKYHFINRAEVLKRKACAETAKVWDKWPKEQALKSAFRDAYQRRIITIDPLVEKPLAATAREDDIVLGNDPSRGSTVTDVTQNIAPQSRSEILAGRMNVSSFSSPEEKEDGETVDPSVPTENAIEHTAAPNPELSEESRSLREKVSSELKSANTPEQIDVIYENYSNAGLGGADKDWLFQATNQRYAEIGVRGEDEVAQEPSEGGENGPLKGVREKIFGYKQVARVKQFAKDSKSGEYSANEISQIVRWCDERVNQLQGTLIS